jgi:glycosyltransferase involved in cell wall biosynthesis
MTLALFTSQLGAVSETFIRRHVEDIRPHGTVAVARHADYAFGGRWDVSCPTLFLDRAAATLPRRLARRAGQSIARQRAGIVAAFLRRSGVRTALGEYLDQFAEFAPLLDRLGIPYVVQGHGIDLSAALRDEATAQSYRAYASARAILTRCEAHRRRLINLGLPAAKVHVNPGGVDIPAQIPARSPEAGKRLLAIGRMTAKKGPIFLLEAFRQAAAADPELRLDYLGDGELAPAVRQFVAACGLTERVTLHGAAPEAVKARLLGECAVFVQHSVTDPATGDEEGLPAAIQEAMAHGLAVVSTRHAGIPEAVLDGETGLLVDEGDTGGMAQAILAARDRASTLGAAGRARAAALYGWEQERTRLRGWLFGETPAA